MSGITLKTPVSISPEDGFYTLTKNVRENAKQSLKMIVLTSPGERVMNPQFGVGIKQYLFEQFSDVLHRTIYQINFRDRKICSNLTSFCYV